MALGAPRFAPPPWLRVSLPTPQPASRHAAARKMHGSVNRTAWEGKGEGASIDESYVSSL